MTRLTIMGLHFHCSMENGGSFFVYMLSFVPMNLHRCWSHE